MFLSLLVSVAFAGVGADLSYEAIGPCVVMTEKPPGCDRDGLCITLKNTRLNEAVAVVIPGYCGETPMSVLDGTIGMRLVDDPRIGLVSVVPPNKWAYMYPPLREVRNEYTGIMGLEPVESFTYYGRMYKGSFDIKTPFLVNEMGNVLHWLYRTAKRGTDCATQTFNLDRPGDPSMVFGAECNNSF